MKFNWIFSKKADQNQKKRCIELEYTLRPRITRFLLERFENECGGDFSNFYFDVDVHTERVWVNTRTPHELAAKLSTDFDVVINGDRRLSIA
ncbi:MAG: hypothetical protein ED555_07640 [Allomuricauda sp.]|nr:MAG: hypothetical protein ED555_07640 [Allomuricauda sp.]